MGERGKFKLKVWEHMAPEVKESTQAKVGPTRRDGEGRGGWAQPERIQAQRSGGVTARVCGCGNQLEGGRT